MMCSRQYIILARLQLNLPFFLLKSVFLKQIFPKQPNVHKKDNHAMDG